MTFLTTTLAPYICPLMAGTAYIVPVAASDTSAEQSISARIDSAFPWTLAVGTALLVAIIAAVAKNLPFAWHFRIFNALFTHRAPPPRSARAGLLFQPVLNSTSTSLTDCDYNMHKSNSTYFADLDIARVHLLGALGFGAQPKGAAMPALGGVSCNFRRPVAPLQRLQIYTRVLSWDAKWLYIASWVVRDDPKASKPASWTLQPWRNKTSSSPADPKGVKSPHVCAVSLARYVFKKGRITVAPDKVLADGGLLPPEQDQGAAATASGVDTADRALSPAWSSTIAEKERLRGLEIARSMAGLDDLIDGLQPADGPALGEW